MSITVSRLVRAGYIARQKSAIDSRSIALTLTRAGAKVRDENAVLNPEMVNRIFRSMKPNEVEIALQGVECLAKYARILLRERKRERDR
jgi:DNA-binding MarR family transcriptional regulator